jgi:hypothetical protein
MSEVTKNLFSGGLDTNTSRSLIPNNKYISANNVNIAGDSNFYALENIQGTTNVKDIISSSQVEVLGVYATNWKINDTLLPCLTIFTGDTVSGNFKIWCYDTQGSVLYEIYEQSVDPSLYFTHSRLVDGVLYPEGGVDILYITDDFLSIKKLRCEIPSPYSPNFLTDLDLKLTRHGGNGTVELSDIVIGGSLLSGAYQFAYQLINPATNQFSKFSLLSNPFQVYLSDEDIVSIGRSGVGLISNRKIILTITPSEEELGYYTHFRLAVLENIEPSGVNIETAQLTQMEAIAPYLIGSSLQNVQYKANIRLETVNLSEIVVDLLAIDHVKTLAIRQNRLLAGNITYKNLEYDNGSPVVSSGSVAKQFSTTNSNIAIDPVFTSLYRGHFRDEVYRFVISYFDSDGNFSFPRVLDMASITDNQCAAIDASGFKDMKFPGRDVVGYTLFANGASVQSLGLQLNGIDNHPSWACGFVILRAKRIKNILFQTPIVPMKSIYAVGPIEEYPIFANELSGTGTHGVDYPDATPMGPFTTYGPRNYFWKEAQDIKFFSTPGGASGSSQEKLFTGEARLVADPAFALGMIFPPEFMYENKPFTFSPTYSIKTVDAALMQLKAANFSDISIGTTTLGRNIKTSIAGTWFATTDGVYYYDSTHGGAKAGFSSRTKQINAYDQFNNFDEGRAVGGFNMFRYDKLDTPGFVWGLKANTQKCGVIQMSSAKNEINYDSALPFAAGSQIAKGAGASQAFYTDFLTYSQTIEIANVIANLDDARYGALTTPHEFIFTGAKVVFSESELVAVRSKSSLPKDVTVWGGDCYVSPALFKLSDTMYGVSSSEKYEGLGGLNLTDSVRNWEKAFNDLQTDSECAISIPVPYKSCAQYIQIVLENEYNQAIIDNEVVVELGRNVPPVGMIPTPVPGLDFSAEGSCRVPLTYQVNPNHKRQNDEKIFRIKDPFLTDNTHFGSRVIYSDQKVYQTSVNGFDIFRVLNIHDLEETYGNIHSLSLVNNDLYSLQEKAVTYFGIGERTLETTDALTLAVSSGEFIGTVTLISNKRGTQHIKSVVNTGDALYFTDNFNKTINRLAGRQVEVISEGSIASSLRSQLNLAIPENKIISGYDPIRKQIWTGNIASTDTFCYVFDEARNLWVSNYDFIPNAFKGLAYSNQALHILGFHTSGNIAVGTMYTGPRTSLLGTDVDPTVTFSINPNMEVGKVFDDILVATTERLDSIDLLVERDSILGPQVVNGIILDVTSRGEGNYRAKVLRDSDNARLRGLFATAKLWWKRNSPQAIVTSVLTKYRPSENKF